MRYFIYEVMRLSWLKRLCYVLFLLLSFRWLGGCDAAYAPRWIQQGEIDAFCGFVNVQPLSQYPDYPAGCESVTAVMALRHAGVSIEVKEFVEEHLHCDAAFYEQDGLLYGPDPYTVFVGDPRSGGSFGCMAPVIEEALLSVGGDVAVTNTTGVTLSALCYRYIDNGVPVMLWATMEMRPVSSGKTWFLSDGRQFTWPAGEHCLLLVGYSDTEYIFNDPRHGAVVAYDKRSVEVAYASLGKQSLVVV